jgi:hypothetical protein
MKNFEQAVIDGTDVLTSLFFSVGIRANAYDTIQYRTQMTCAREYHDRREST